MAFKEVASLDADQTISLGGVNRKTNKANPKSIEGYYLGAREVPDQKKKSGKSYIHVFQTPKGNIGVWGKTDMDRKLLTCTPGTMIRVSHSGMRGTKNGEMYVYKVEQDQDNAIEVSTANAQASAGDTFETTESYLEETDADEGAETFEADDFEAPAIPAAKVATAAADAAARSARVRAMFAKK